MQLVQAGIDIIKNGEGCVLTAYPDPGTGGDPWTIGYGHTGPEVYEGLVWTQGQADDAFDDDIAKFQSGVARYIGDAKTTDNQFSAFVSLAYNIGLGAFAQSTALMFHKSGDYADAADHILLWDKAAGRVMLGLVKRRAQERELYLS
jgi:lysozyme